MKLNGNRTVTGYLRGFDQFMNLVLDETIELVRTPHSAIHNAARHHRLAVASLSCVPLCSPQVSDKEQNKIGMVVIRGNSVVMIEALEKLWGE